MKVWMILADNELLIWTHAVVEGKDLAIQFNYNNCFKQIMKIRTLNLMML